MPDEHIIYAYELDRAGAARALASDEALDPASPAGGFTWLHMCASHPETRNVLMDSADLDPIVIDAMSAEQTRPRVLAREEGTLVILRAMNLNRGQDPEDMISIRIWIEENRVITTRRRDIKAIGDIIGLIRQGEGPRSPGEFLTMITDRLFSRMEPFLIDLEDRISFAEELLVSGSSDEMSNDASLVRKRTTIFSRYIAPQRTVLEALVGGRHKWLTEDNKEHLVESMDRVTRYVEELQELRDRSQILNDEVNSAHGRRLNDITYIFSVAATVFLPLSFLTGLMGINIGGMPGVNSDQAFWIFGGLCAMIVVVQVALFKRLGWF